MSNSEEMISAAKQGFEAAFSEKSFYNRQTQDSSHIEAILGILPVKRDMRILDLGTGSGYLAFAIAQKHPDITVVGLDIVEKALEQNRQRAAHEGLNNVSFASYDGSTFPFESRSFDMVVTRYSLHHFPDINSSLSEVDRILSGKGCFFISDPAPNEGDENGFADEYMQVKPDGHIKFRSLAEWKSLCGNCGFQLADSFISSIRFPRKYEEIYETIMKRHPKETVSSYGIEVTGGEIFITEQVNNMLFCREI
ncbi:MAG: methyltransferase domain-containing protein [Ruminococcus sp.]|uniref:class I SAM-dependent methyltransferase n=1 Tax=Ruminococcus sp. TaxID=41978 RepID=UPI0025CED816|nr:class I SAM-dependent methyltransferase [Ruminococcus sp.]MBR5683373.1 methyltransferase domain-containing protein [Ruminococcus sp.]